jgi:hypothetical protein
MAKAICYNPVFEGVRGRNLMKQYNIGTAFQHTKEIASADEKSSLAMTKH